VDIQRLRNLTTERLHTEMGHVYEDLEWISGHPGLMTHMLPRMLEAVTPWLKEHVTDPRFWEDRYDSTHTGTYELPDPTAKDRDRMKQRYFAQPDPLANKETLIVSQ